MESKEITMDKKYTTRDGREARVLAVDLGGSQPVAVALKTKEGNGYLYRVRKDGRCSPETAPDSNFDLVEKKTKVTRWVNVYEGGASGFKTGISMFDSREQAESMHDLGKVYVASVPVEFEA